MSDAHRLCAKRCRLSRYKLILNGEISWLLAGVDGRMCIEKARSHVRIGSYAASTYRQLVWYKLVGKRGSRQRVLQDFGSVLKKVLLVF